MNLFKIQNDLIADRISDAWYRLLADGPTFNYRWTYGWSGDGNFSEIVGEHRSHAVCREEPSLTMSWGLDVHERRDAQELRFEWADQFVNKSVRPFWVDFFWNGGLIDRVELCSVDGGHGIIPMPSYDNEVTDFEVAVAYLVHDLGGGQAHDHPGRYLDQLGFKHVRDSDRQGAGSSSA